MVNQAILGGLKSAVARGQSLQKAYYSFINAGYEKIEVDEAFATLTMPTENSIVSNPSQIVKQQYSVQPKSNLPPISIKPLPPNQIQFQKVIVPPANAFPRVQTSAIVKDASEYSSPKKSNSVAILLMVLILIFLMAILFGVIVFKEEILQLLG